MRFNRKPTRRLQHRSGLALESLEPRQLLTAYLGQSLADYFHFPKVLLDNIAPPSGTEFADFGAAAAGLGDIDGDNYGDFAISAPGTLNPDGSTALPGAVYLFSGKAGSLIRTLSDGFAGFGASIANIGDINGDGKADLAIGSANVDPTSPSGTNHTGRAYVYSSADGSALLTLNGTGLSDEFGYAVIGAGDLNNDGINDLVVGAPGAGPNGEGQANIFSGADGAAIRTLTGEAAGDRFGHAIFTSAAVINVPPGSPSLIWIGAPLNDGIGPDAGRIYAFSGITGAEIWRHDSADASFVVETQYGAALVAVPYQVAAGPTILLWIGVPGAFNDFGAAEKLDGNTGSALPVQSTLGTRFGDGFGSRLWLGGPAEVTVYSPGAVGTKYATFDGTAREQPFGTPWDGPVFYVGDLDADGFVDSLARPAGSTSAKVYASRPGPSVLNKATGANDALTFVYFAAGPQYPGVAFVNNLVLSYGQIPGMRSSDIILGVNNSGLLVVRGVGYNGLAGLYIVSSDVRTRLSDAVTSVDAPAGVTPDYENFKLVKVGNDGSIIFLESAATLQQHSWVLKNGVLTYLWGFGGNPLDVNSRGTILGWVLDEPNNAYHMLLRAADGSVTDITTPNFTPSRLSDTGDVAGFLSSGSTVGLWHNGVVTALTPAWPPSTTIVFPWTVVGMNQRSQVLLTLTTGSLGRPDGYDFTVFVYDPSDGLRSLEGATFGRYVHGSTYSSDTPLAVGLALAPDGTVLLNNGVVSPTTDTTYWQSADGSPLGLEATSGDYAVTVNGYGDAVVFMRTGSRWMVAPILGRKFETQGSGISLARQALVSTDPATGNTTVFIVTPIGTFVGNGNRTIPRWPWRFPNPLLGDPPFTIVDRAALFVSADQRVHFTGIDKNGHLIVYFHPQGDKTRWVSSDLTTAHIQAGGQTFVPVAGNLTAFATPWGGMNIAYLDGIGNVQTVWWAPGLPLWRTDNLSTNSGFSGTLHGTLVSYVTPWGGLNVAGTDADGNLVALWWAPGLAHWRSDRLVSGTPAQLDENTLTAYATPWGGLNIAGLDKSTGKLTAYWWTPGKPTWTVDEFTIQNAPADLHLTGPLSSAVSPTGDMFITAATSDHHLANIWFSAATNYLWTFEDVTMAV